MEVWIVYSDYTIYMCCRKPLKTYSDANVVLTLPVDTLITDYTYIAVGASATKVLLILVRNESWSFQSKTQSMVNSASEWRTPGCSCIKTILKIMLPAKCMTASLVILSQFLPAISSWFLRLLYVRFKNEISLEKTYFQKFI